MLTVWGYCPGGVPVRGCCPVEGLSGGHMLSWVGRCCPGEGGGVLREGSTESDITVPPPPEQND